MFTMFIKIAQKIKSFVADEVLFGTAIVTIGVFISSIFSYLLQFALGHLLSVSDYGTFNALVALANIIGVPAAVLSTSITKISSELKAGDRYDKLTQLFWKLSLMTLLLGLVVSFITFVAKMYLADLLNISNANIISYFSLYLGAVFFSVVPLAYLQGLLRFKAFAFANVLGGGLRFGLPVLFVYLGWRVNGVMLGLFLGMVSAYTANVLLLKKNFRPYDSESVSPLLKKVLLFSLPVLFVNLGLMLLNNLDLILVKRFFSEELSGYYAGAVTVSKVLLFGAGTVSVVMFPQISEAYARNEDYIGKFTKFFMLQTFITVVGVLVFSLFPGLITKVMFGQKFIPSAQYIPLFSIFVGLYVLINFLIMFLLAVGKTGVYKIQIPLIVGQFVLINLYHTSLFDVIWVNIGISLVVLLILSVYSAKVIYSAPQQLKAIAYPQS